MTDKKQQLALRLLRAVQDEKGGKINQVQRQHLVEAINEEAKTHNLSPNEVLSAAMQDFDNFTLTENKTKELSAKYWKAINDEKLQVIDSTQKVKVLREISEEAKMYNLSIDAITAPLPASNSKTSYYPIN